MQFSIIIPVYNEENAIQQLLEQLKPYSSQHEVLFVNDGSTDQTFHLLKQCKYINLYSIPSQSGKGEAVRLGLNKAKYNHVILMDGDLEIHSSNISTLMTALSKENIQAVFGSRWLGTQREWGLFSFGNWFLNFLFNVKNKSTYSDVLCCMKTFNKKDISISALESTGFDIEVELSTMIHHQCQSISEVAITYDRRSSKDGKKLKVVDGFVIMKRIFSS